MSSEKALTQQEQWNEKEVVDHINKILISNLDVREMLRGVHSELRQLLNSEGVSLVLFDDRGKGFRYIVSETGENGRELDNDQIDTIEGTLWNKVVETGLPVITPDIRKVASWIHQKLFDKETVSSLVFPLEYKGKVIGTLNFGSKEKNHFSEEHFRVLRQISAGFAISAQNALLYEETRKRLDELTILYEMTKISHSALNLDQMLREIMKSLQGFFKFETVSILLIDENTKRFFLHPSSIGFSNKDVENLELALGKGLTGWVAERGESLLVNDVHKDSRYLGRHAETLSEMCAPLKVGGKVIGVIDAQSQALNAFSNDDLRLFEMAGGHLATIIENVRSEERYRAVVESALDGVLVTGGDYRLTYINERLAELLGFTREELIGMDFRDFLDEESKRMMVDRDARRQGGERVSPRFELNILRKGGEIRNVEVSSTLMWDSQGAVNTVAFLKDITEKRKMEEQLFQAEKLRAVGEMANGVAHDFNNALAIILGNTQLLLLTAKDKELKETLRVIEKVAKDSAQTVRRLQEFTKSRVRQELFKLDINAIVKDAIEITRPKWKDEAQGRGIHIEMVSHFEEIPPAAGNVSELREVITNMIFNATEAMPEGGRIEIRTFRRKAKVYVQISDTGVGMAEEVRKKVFEPFFTTKPFTNTGLGLSMSYGIIRRFGGEIEVESKLGKGTTFTISLPIGLEGKEDGTVPSTIEKGREARILVIDDEEYVRSVLSRSLSQANHQVTTAKDGEEGVRLFREEEFDMVLTDLGMPNMSGWEVCKTIKELSPNTPVGMITGWGMQINQSKREDSGVDFIISKPFDFNEVLNVVAEAIESKAIRKRP